MSNKTINVNELLSAGSKKKKKTQKNKKEKPIAAPNKLLKERLLKHVKEHQNQHKQKKNLVNSSDEKSDFETSMDYLVQLEKKIKKEKHERRKTKKRPPSVNLDNPSQLFIQTEPNNNSTTSQFHSISPPVTQSITPPTIPSITYPNVPPIEQPIIQTPIPSVMSPPVISPPVIPPVICDTNNEKIEIPSIGVPDNKPIEIIIENNNDSKEKISDEPSNEVKQDLFAPEPPYGCLKNGPKPTYREWKNKTQKSKATIRLDDFPDEDDSLPSKYKQVKRKTTRSKYNIGKKNNRIGIFIKNNTTRKRIQKEHTNLKKKSINEIKQFLFEKNLLKVGSTAPNHVLRSLYEQCILAGNIKNKGDGVILHNFLEED